MHFYLLLGLLFSGPSAQPEPPPPETVCPAERRVVEIRASNDSAIRFWQALVLAREVGRDNTIVRLGPGVDLDFSRFEDRELPIAFGRCVTLTSVARMAGTRPVSFSTTSAEAVAGLPLPGEGRSASSEGPVLRFGRHRPGAEVFLTCFSDGVPHDRVRISGFRLEGPSRGQQRVSNFGIQIRRCVDVEIANMEIAGWGGAGIRVDDDEDSERQPANGRGGRITGPQQILIHDNYIHHNQHPQSPYQIPGCPFPQFCTRYGSLGYGVVIGIGAWAAIYRNLFDHNRHAIAASHDAAGYRAEHNLVLRGGGYHGPRFSPYTHSFDVHGADCGGHCGVAGGQFWFYSNAFQFQKQIDIHIRGTPLFDSVIDGNVFPQSRGDAIVRENNVAIGLANVFGLDTFGRYGVCDFDGDGADDLFLATGANWWYSSGGEFPWSFLNRHADRQETLRFGDFDGDRRCDVLADHGGRWEVSSGGTGPWTSIGRFGRPFAEVRFGRFDPRFRDHRRNVLLRTTHAFWRRGDGQWFVTPLTGPDWQPVGSSDFPLSALRFGDFTGDGVTDVLAVVDGRWSISESAVQQWRPINTLRDPVARLHIANMDADDNIDDLLRLDRRAFPIGPAAIRSELTWMRSRNGVAPWRLWRRYSFTSLVTPDFELSHFGFAGRFGIAPGGGTLVIDRNRVGQFYSPAETAAGANPDWHSLFPY